MRLHEQRTALADHINALSATNEEAIQVIADFRVYLDSAKFSGFDSRDGTPLNYINTTEVHEVLSQIAMLLRSNDRAPC